MKAIILITIVFFSLTNITAQEVSSDMKISTSVEKKELVTKVDFYKALIKANNFDVKVKEVKIAKSGYYNKILIKSGFRIKTRKSCRLVYNNIKEVSLLHDIAS